MRSLGGTWQAFGHVYNRLFRHDVWNVGIVDAPIATFLTLGARPLVHWLPEPPRGTFIADPFMVETETGPVILVEGFVYGTGKGYIAALTGDADGQFSAPVPVIEEPTHLSYPYIVRHGGRIYCIPETGTARDVHLYEATAFPHRWERRATLIEGFAALDATVFRHGGQWWLLCSEQDGTPGTTLHAWHAADLLGPWTPHAANPIKTDLRSSRPAGTPFVHDGHLYRPAQDCTRTYGGAVVINRVITLTPEAFAEETVARVEPYADGPYHHGLHTLAACGQRTVIDGKCRRFVPDEARRFFRRAVTALRWR